MSKFCSFFAFGPRSVTTNLVPAEPFVSGPTWFHLSAVGGGFRKPVLLPPAMPSFGLQSLRTAPSLPRKTTLGRQVTFRGCALRCSTVIMVVLAAESGWGLSRSVMPGGLGFYLALAATISAS